MSASPGHLRREIGLIGLTFIGVGGILGSGWLFAPMLAAQATGPAAILAWVIGGAVMLLLALIFAEISSMLPVAGGIATVPLLSHGRTYSMIVGWSAWVAYCIAAPIEVELMLRYLDVNVPWIFSGVASGEITIWGTALAIVLLAAMVALNAIGVAVFARINSTITWFKIAIPLLVSVVIIADSFTVSNFSAQGGFMPYGIDGMLTAVSSGGVILSYLGFRHIIDLAGEARRPQFTIPVALALTLVICFVIYFLVQVAFIGALDPKDIDRGWRNLHFESNFGPLGALAASVGIMWLVSLLNVSAVISPFGGAFIQLGGNARLVLAMSYSGFFPRLFEKLTSRGVPLRAHILNFLVGCVVFATLNLKEMTEIASAILIFSFAAGPFALMTMRQLAPDLPRSFSLPAGPALSLIGFIFVTLIIYWSGWETTWRLLLVLAVGLPFIAYRIRLQPPGERDLYAAIWLAPYLAGLALLSYLGRHGGGLHILPLGVDILVGAVLSGATFWYAMRLRLSPDRFDQVLDEVREEMLAEAGGDEAGSNLTS